MYQTLKNIKLLLLVFVANHVIAQDSLQMSMDQVIAMASQKSLQAFKAQNMYLASYWEHKSFLAGQLPNVSLKLTPVDFRRAMTKRYDFEQNIDVFREQKTMENYGRLALTQTIPGIGGQVYVDSDISRLVNFANNQTSTYSATWIRLGLIQPLFAFNKQKWEKKISPLKFEIAKKEYLKSQQQTMIQAVNLYSDLHLAHIKKEIALNNFATADTLFKLGSKRFDLLSVNREELLNLELSKFNAEIEISKAEQDIQKALFNLHSFLGMGGKQKISTQLPGISHVMPLQPDEALEIAKKNNPELMMLEQRKLEADQTLDKAYKDSRFNANLTASFGLNQYAEEFRQAYKDPLDQQIVVLGVQIPILDWGQNKGKKQMAKKNQEITYIENQQKQSDFEQALVLKVLDFNLQPKIVESASKARQIAELSFELTKNRFMLGKADVLQMENAIKARQSASEKYIQAVFAFWKTYYELQALTLFDLQARTNLAEDFDRLLEGE
jgi:outer membrane protein TolC